MLRYISAVWLMPCIAAVHSLHTGSGASSLFRPSAPTLPVTLNATGSLVTFDYGSEVAGKPFFTVSSLDRPIQVELKYSEELSGLGAPFGDGPLVFDAGLSNTFRIETFNVTEPGTAVSYFIQGGQRWQSLKQLTPGSMVITDVGFEASIDMPDLANLPGSFECSNHVYNEIWKLGARAVSAACVDNGTQSATWDIVTDGALIRGQETSLSAFGTAFADYQLNFSTKIVRGGSGWSVGGLGTLQLMLVSDLPKATTFVNTNRTITPPNTIQVATGFSFVNQTTLPSLYIDSFPMPFNVTEDTWYDISTSFISADLLMVHVNGLQVFNISLAGYGVILSSGFSPAPAGTGSWGFGGWQDQISIVKDVKVSAANGTLLYENDMSSTQTLSEYGVNANTATTCLDGAKRDRLVWLGDFFHTSRIIAASTARRDHVLGTLQYLQAWQSDEGLLPISAPLGYDPNYTPDYLSDRYAILQDYQLLGILAYTRYFEVTGDIDFAQALWPGIQKQVAWLLSQVNSTTHLVDFGGFIGVAAGTAISAATVQALNGVATIASSLGDTVSSLNYTTVAQTIAASVNDLLWNAQLGVYSTSLTDRSNYSVADISFAITSGIADSTRTASLIQALQQLELGPGFKDSTAVSSASTATNISPNTNGFLLSALMMSNTTAPAKFLLDNLWTAMIINDATYSGASWEYVNAFDRSPGLSLFTSLSHPWGGAPTYLLQEGVAGLRALQPGFKEFAVVPGYTGYGLSSASATVPTLFGSLFVQWETSSGVLNVNVSVPSGTSGIFALPNTTSLGKWSINGKDGRGGMSIPLPAGNVTLVVEIP